jgi:hypothetical protein
MFLSPFVRRALTAAVVAAAGAAGSYAFRHYMDRRTHRSRKDDRIDVSRWEGEGGSPPDLNAAVPHQPVGVRHG